MSRAGTIILFVTLSVSCGPSGGVVPPPPPPLTPSSPTPPLPPAPAIVRQVGLTTPSGPGACAAAEQLIEDQVVTAMRVQVELARRWSGWGGGGGGGMDAGTVGGGGPGGASVSTTNVQTAGVDEADLMKNDGSRIVTLSGGALVLLRSWPDTQLRVVGRLWLGTVPRELLLLSDRVVVFSDLEDRTRATFVDISDMANPAVVGEVEIPGQYLTARRVGTAIRVVLKGSLSFPPGVSMIPPGGYTSDGAAWDALEAQNEAIIRAQPLGHWLPPAQTRDAAGQVAVIPHPCDQVSAPNAPELLGMTAVATLDSSDPTRADRWSILGNADQVYASKTSLYLASAHWWWWPGSQSGSATYLHRFDLSTTATAAYTGSGVVDGTVRDSYSLDELDGRLRVATTLFPFEGGGAFWANRVTVLAPSGTELVEVGRSPDFGLGEMMQSARFLGTRAFVVTFRRVDPLFTLDLSDPTAPRLVGELTVPGFSSYLHPVSDTQLVGIGTNAGSLQVSLFDVSDLARPAASSVFSVAGSWSEAQQHPHAFTWMPSRQRFAIPCLEWSTGSELLVFHVSGGALVPLGALPGAADNVKRGILTETDAYAVGDQAVRVARLSDLSTPVATALLGSAPDAGAPDAGSLSSGSPDAGSGGGGLPDAG